MTLPEPSCGGGLEQGGAETAALKLRHGVLTHAIEDLTIASKQTELIETLARTLKFVLTSTGWRIQLMGDGPTVTAAEGAAGASGVGGVGGVGEAGGGGGGGGVRRRTLSAAHRSDGAGVVVTVWRHGAAFSGSEESALRSLVRVTANRVAQLRMIGALESARDEAERATRVKSAFLATMSHEIRTPLSAVIGFADIAADPQTSPAEAIEALSSVKRSGEHLLGLINDVLDLSRFESGRVELEESRVEVAGVVADVVEILTGRAKDRGNRIEVEFKTPCPAVIRADALRLRQALINLVGNAIKFTSGGVVTIGLSHEPGRGQISFEVWDTGIGMSPQQLGAIFTPFAQADASVARRFGGTGLGLAITRKIAELMGGGVEVSSELGRGSLFTLRIAAGDTAGSAMIEAMPEQLREGGNVGGGAGLTCRLEIRGRRVLLAEDGPDNRRLIGHILSRAGGEVTAVENGAEALEAVRRAREAGRPYDVILMDVQMPLMDGIEATTRLRAQGYAGPVLALTARSASEAHKECAGAGFDEILTKPIRRNELIAAVAFAAERVRPAA